MKVRTYIFLILSGVALFACKPLEPENPVTFTACSSLPRGRASAAAAVLDGKAYVLCGRTGVKTTGYLNDFWQYDPQTDTWTELARLPFKARVKAVAASCDGKLYAGLGFNGRVYVDSCYLRDWWCYDPVTATWERKADFPTRKTDGAVSFVAGKCIYVGLGFFDGFSSDTYKYDTETGEWTKCGDGKIYARMAATGCSVGSRCFAGTGFNTYNLNDWWEFVPKTEEWHKKSSLPGRGRVLATSTAVNNCIYVIGGRFFGGTETREEFYDGLMEYDVNSDTWRLRGYLPNGGRENAISFCIDGKGYFGLGADKNGAVLNDLYSWK